MVKTRSGKSSTPADGAASALAVLNAVHPPAAQAAAAQIAANPGPLMAAPAPAAAATGGMSAEKRAEMAERRRLKRIDKFGQALRARNSVGGFMTYAKSSGPAARLSSMRGSLSRATGKLVIPKAHAQPYRDIVTDVNDLTRDERQIMSVAERHGVSASAQRVARGRLAAVMGPILRAAEITNAGQQNINVALQAMYNNRKAKAPPINRKIF